MAASIASKSVTSGRSFGCSMPSALRLTVTTPSYLSEESLQQMPSDKYGFGTPSPSFCRGFHVNHQLLL